MVGVSVIKHPRARWQSQAMDEVTRFVIKSPAAPGADAAMLDARRAAH